MNRSVAQVEGFERRFCWAARDHIGRTDSHDIEKGCNIVMLSDNLIIQSDNIQIPPQGNKV
jgi:hypothetical protein